MDRLSKICKGKTLTFNKEGKLTEKAKYCYAYHVIENNPIPKSELNYYKGNLDKKPHGIEQKYWKKAYKEAKEDGKVVIYDRSRRRS